MGSIPDPCAPTCVSPICCAASASHLSLPAPKCGFRTPWIRSRLRFNNLAAIVGIQYGKFTSDDWRRHVCGRIEKIHHEKQTDVNIAVALLTDAQEDRFDDAVLITADSDQVRTVEYIRNAYMDKKDLDEDTGF